MQYASKLSMSILEKWWHY